QSTVIYAYVESTLENSEDEFNEVIDNLVEFLDERPEFKYKIIALGLEIYSRRYTDALYYLNGLTTVSEEEIDFVTVENYNINYLKDWVNYIPTSGALDTLYEIGMKTHPYTGFARSLYYQLTDEILQLEIPDISGITLPRSSNSTETGLVIKSYPNPLQGDTYNIEFSGEKSSVSAHITVYNIFGEIIKSFNTQIHDNGIFPINTEKWPSNIYFLTVESELGDLLYSCKFIKM
ncbi:MAG TPA: T9SS type A sorting domain-containing protein, partial [Nitrososphaeraceae archaeon]|nr:T9SS type A sorting domain-containing protein [Nitrososphaeraceae archaeon]